LRFAKSLSIPCLIFSDAEKNIKTSVKEQFSQCGSAKNEADSIIFLNDGNDFERQLISDGFSDEIKKVIASFDVYANEQHKQAKERGLCDYNDEKVYKIITDSKTKYGPAIAEEIIKSEKGLPPKVKELFTKIESILQIRVVVS